MLSSRSRIVATGVGALVLLALAAVAAYLLPPRQTGDVAVPPAEATPEQVVRAYLDALNAHDCETAQAVSTDVAAASAKSWCEHVAALTNIDVRQQTTGRPKDSGLPASDHVADVAVSFDLKWRPLHNDGSMDEGPTPWGYLLMRSSSDAPWRIFDQGLG